MVYFRMNMRLQDILEQQEFKKKNNFLLQNLNSQIQENIKEFEIFVCIERNKFNQIIC